MPRFQFTRYAHLDNSALLAVFVGSAVRPRIVFMFLWYGNAMCFRANLFGIWTAAI